MNNRFTHDSSSEEIVANGSAASQSASQEQGNLLKALTVMFSDADDLTIRGTNSEKGAVLVKERGLSVLADGKGDVVTPLSDFDLTAAVPTFITKLCCKVTKTTKSLPRRTWLLAELGELEEAVEIVATGDNTRTAQHELVYEIYDVLYTHLVYSLSSTNLYYSCISALVDEVSAHILTVVKNWRFQLILDSVTPILALEGARWAIDKLYKRFGMAGDELEALCETFLLPYASAVVNNVSNFLKKEKL